MWNRWLPLPSVTQVGFQVFAGHAISFNAKDLTLSFRGSAEVQGPVKGYVYLEQFR